MRIFRQPFSNTLQAATTAKAASHQAISGVVRVRNRPGSSLCHTPCVAPLESHPPAAHLGRDLQAGALQARRAPQPQREPPHAPGRPAPLVLQAQQRARRALKLPVDVDHVDEQLVEERVRQARVVRRAVAGLPAGLLDGHQAAPPAAAQSAHLRWRGGSPGVPRSARRRAGQAHSSLYALICFLCSLYLRNLPRHCLGASCARRRGSAAAPPRVQARPPSVGQVLGKRAMSRRSRSPAPGRTCPGLRAAVASRGGQATVRRPASTRRSCGPPLDAISACHLLATLLRIRQELHQQVPGKAHPLKRMQVLRVLHGAAG
jgi:hypothetical protein